jgi:hypothetical protein
VAKKSESLVDQFALVRWDDAVGAVGWAEDGDAATHPHECTTIGVVIADTPQALTLAGTWSRNKDEPRQTNGRMTIPRGFIKHIWILTNVDD